MDNYAFPGDIHHGICDHMSFTCLMLTHMVATRKSPDKLKVLEAVDVSVLHKLEGFKESSCLSHLHEFPASSLPKQSVEEGIATAFPT